nr:hypothetical protein [Nocardia tengchongensis]
MPYAIDEHGIRCSWDGGGGAGGMVSSAVAQAAPASECDGWRMDTLAQGLGNAENLETDGNGGFFVSSLDVHKLYDIDAAGTVTVVRDDFSSGPGALQRDGSTLYVGAE